MRLRRKKRAKIDLTLHAEHELFGEVYVLRQYEVGSDTVVLTYETERSIHERYSLRLHEIRALEG
jgi:hypothetical protein